MSVLARQQIAEAIEKVKLLEPVDLQKCLGPASYELRLGGYREGDKFVVIEPGQMVTIGPNSFVLLGTVERVSLPADLTGTLYLKSSFGRHGIVPWSQGYVDPGYSGGLTIVMHNLTRAFVPIVGHSPICHIVFHRLEQATDQLYKGAYQGAASGTASKGEAPIKVIGTALVESPAGFQKS